MEKTKKEKEILTSTRKINRLWRCPSIDINARSRDCHATNALRAISVLMTHKYRGSIIVLSISKSVEPNEEHKEMTSNF